MGISFEMRERSCALIAVHQMPFWAIEREEWDST